MTSQRTMQHMADMKSQLREAERQYRDAVRAAYPIGSTAICERNGSVMVEIVGHCYGDDVRVLSQTGREYRVSAYHLTPTIVTSED